MFCRILLGYFNKGDSNDSFFVVQILEKIEVADRTLRNILDTSQICKKKVIETFWLLQLKTLSRYGWNGRLSDEFKALEKEVLIGRISPPLPRIHHGMGSSGLS